MGRIRARGRLCAAAHTPSGERRHVALPPAAEGDGPHAVVPRVRDVQLGAVRARLHVCQRAGAGTAVSGGGAASWGRRAHGPSRGERWRGGLTGGEVEGGLEARPVRVAHVAGARDGRHLGSVQLDRADAVAAAVRLRGRGAGARARL